MDFSEVYAELVKMSRPSLVSAPPVCVIPPLRSHPLINALFPIHLIVSFQHRVSPSR